MLRSVIICSHNRAVLLKRLLASLARQTFHPEHFEVVVVDDNSGDNTAQVCQMMRSELPNLKYIFTGRKVGSSEARNMGVKESSGDLLLFTDDDCIPRTDWVEQLSTVLEREQIAAGAVATTAANYFKLCHNIAEFHAFMPGNKAGPIEFIAGANMAFRKKVLEDLGMFKRDQQYACDMEIILRARSRGYRIFFEPGALVTHDPDRIALGEIFRYSADHASTTILLRNNYRSLLDTPFILRSPSQILMASPFIALKVTAGIYIKNPMLMRRFWTAPFVYTLKIAWCWGAARGLRNQGMGEATG